MNIITGILTAVLLLILSSTACNSPADPGSSPNPPGNIIAWFNGLGNNVDLYFPASDSLVQGAYITGEVPNDILSPEQGLMVVLSSLDARIQVFETDSTGSEYFSVQLPSGSNPYLMSWDGEHLWVTLLLTSQVARVDLVPGGGVELFDLRGNPTSIASTGQRVFVGNASWPDPSVTGGITVLDASTGDSLGSVQTPDNVIFLKYFESTGMVHAVTTTYTGDGLISILDPVSMEITAQVPTGGSPGQPVECGGGFVAGGGWASGSLYFYGESGVLEDEWDTGHLSAAGVVCLGDTAYVTDPTKNVVFVADCEGRSLLDTLTAGASGPQGITSVSP
ncbi:MAG: hypothetical protein AVO35_04230 [Candidatus Aegiribacteria sp. MLS_C]|nr:MAG: hypothetical protein AVO35_04230 [Candidatus Aegiribacteria sp. MLS_C]